jgi:hypothetical protein
MTKSQEKLILIFIEEYVRVDFDSAPRRSLSRRHQASSGLPPSLPLMSPFRLPSAGLVRIPPGMSHPSGYSCILPRNPTFAWFPANARWHVFSISAFLRASCMRDSDASLPSMIPVGIGQTMDQSSELVRCRKVLIKLLDVHF